MKTFFDELLEKLNGLKILQKNIDWEEDIPEDLYNEYFTDYDLVDELLNIKKHRWYETSISVLKINDQFLGVKHVSDLKSESMEVEDCFVHLKFMEMKAVETITYHKFK